MHTQGIDFQNLENQRLSPLKFLPGCCLFYFASSNRWQLGYHLRSRTKCVCFCDKGTGAYERSGAKKHNVPWHGRHGPDFTELNLRRCMPGVEFVIDRPPSKSITM
jgi:hypothetical protein